LADTTGEVGSAETAYRTIGLPAPTGAPVPARTTGRPP